MVSCLKQGANDLQKVQLMPFLALAYSVVLEKEAIKRVFVCFI